MFVVSYNDINMFLNLNIKYMELTDEKINQVVDYLNKKSTNGTIVCPVCGHHNWAITKTIMELRDFNNGDIILGAGSSVMPFITLTCAHCANTLFFNALRLGVVDKDDKEK